MPVRFAKRGVRPRHFSWLPAFKRSEGAESRRGFFFGGFEMHQLDYSAERSTKLLAVTLPVDIIRRLRMQSAQSGQTMRRIVTDALERALPIEGRQMNSADA